MDRLPGHPPLVQRLLLAGGDATQLHEGVAMDALGLAEAAAHAEILELLRRPADERDQPLQLSPEVGLHGLRWMAPAARSKRWSPALAVPRRLLRTRGRLLRTRGRLLRTRGRLLRTRGRLLRLLRAAAAPPQGGCCAWRLWAAAAPGGSGRRVAPKGSADPQAALPRPRVLEPAASQAADVLEPADAAAFDRPGVSSAGAAPGVHVPALGAGLACGAAHLAWQLRTVDFHSRADCLRKFQPGRMS